MLQQLGINATVIIQFGIFVFTFYALIKIVYQPYADAYQGRLKNTKGSEEVASEIQKKTAELQAQYSVKAKDIHGKISEIFKKSKADAASEYDQIINQSKSEAAGIVDQNRKSVNQKIDQLERDLAEMKGSIVVAINNKLLGK